MPVVRTALLRSAGAVAAVNALGFVATAATKSHKVTDLCGCLGFVAAVTSSLLMAPRPIGVRAIVLASITAVWSVRLALYLFRRVLHTGDDERLRQFFPQSGEPCFDFRRSAFPLRLGVFWTLQSMWAYIVTLPVTMAIVTGRAPTLGVFGICSAALAGAGFLLEATADYQKFSFKYKPENSSRFCDVGVWSWCRHPNYAGDIMGWIGIFMLAAPALSSVELAVGALSPLFTAILLLGVSGVPMLEKQQQAKYGDDPAFQRWKNQTPILVPCPPVCRRRTAESDS